MGEALTDAEQPIFTALTGGRQHEPLERVEEFCAVIGRRGGKSRSMATLAAYIGGLCSHQLVPGETGVASDRARPAAGQDCARLLHGDF
jgi:hypothetical protein